MALDDPHEFYGATLGTPGADTLLFGAESAAADAPVPFSASAVVAHILASLDLPENSGVAINPTWNNGATAFDGVLINVDDQGSNNDSNPLHIKRNDATLAKVSKYGTLTSVAVLASSALYVGATDVVLRRGGPNILAMHSGESAQAFQLYNTTSNGGVDFTRASQRWSAGVFEFGTEQGGSGAAADMKIIGSTGVVGTTLTIDPTPNRASGTATLRLQVDATSVFEANNFGNVTVGASSGAVTLRGTVDVDDLPTSDPAHAGRLWNDAGTLKISAG